MHGCFPFLLLLFKQNGKNNENCSQEFNSTSRSPHFAFHLMTLSVPSFLRVALLLVLHCFLLAMCI